MRAPIRARGSFYDVGYAIGRQTAPQINLAMRLVMRRLLEAFNGNMDALLRLAEAHAMEGQTCFPPSFDYLQGLSAGCGVPFSELLVLSFTEEISAQPAERCSTLAVYADSGWVIGHQEDYWPEFFGLMCVFDLEINGFPRTVSLNYPGMLPHLSGSQSEARVALVNDALWPDVMPGAPKQPCHLRAALQATPHAAIASLQEFHPALSDHFLAAGTESACSLEVAPLAHVRSNWASIRGLHPRDGWFAHTNSIQRLLLRDPDPAPPGSTLRQAMLETIAKADPPRTFEAMLRRLTARDGILNRDMKLNWTYQPNSVTLATVVAEPSSGRITFVRYPSDDGALVIDRFQL